MLQMVKIVCVYATGESIFIESIHQWHIHNFPKGAAIHRGGAQNEPFQPEGHTRRSQQKVTPEGHNKRPHQKAITECHTRRPQQKATPEGDNRRPNQKAITECHSRRPQQKVTPEVHNRGVYLWVEGYVCLWVEGCVCLWDWGCLSLGLGCVCLWPKQYKSLLRNSKPIGPFEKR